MILRAMVGGLTFVASALAGLVPAWAQIATRVQLPSVVESSPRSSDPHFFSDLGGRAIFFAGEADGAQLPQVWVSDGTTAGTEALGSTCSDGEDGQLCVVRALAAHGLVYFVAGGFGDTCKGAVQLFRTDGTRRGTFSLTPCGLYVRPELAISGGALYFNGEGRDGLELWRTDGTREGTSRLKSFAGSPSWFESTWLSTVEDRALVFARVPDRDDVGLWQSDGTEAGTTLARSFPSRFFPSQLAAGQGRAFFLIDDGAGTQLWASDGTADGTRALTRFGPQAEFRTDAFALLGDRLCFGVAPDGEHFELWESTGTIGSTRPIAAIPPDAKLANGTLGSKLALAGQRVLFVLATADGFELWRTDGEPSSARHLLHLGSGAFAPGVASSGLVMLGSRVLFVASEAPNTSGVWTTDGTASGTFALTEADLANAGHVSDLFLIDGAAYFVAGSLLQGQEIWQTDGTPSGTRQLTFLAEPSPFGRGFIFRPRGWLGRVGNRLFFAALDEAHGIELWVTDGAPASTRLVADLATAGAGPRPRSLFALDEQLLFTAEEASSTWLYRTGGTATSTHKVTPQRAFETCGGERSDFIGLADGLGYFLMDEWPGSCHLWRTDGTDGGTFQITSSVALPLGLDEDGAFVDLDGRLFFTVSRATSTQLWTSDGTVEGTTLSVDFGDLVEPKPSGTWSAFDGSLLFFGSTPQLGEELWRTDGTPTGTHRLTDFDSEVTVAREFRPVELEGRLYLVVARGVGLGELWRTDGTSTGTEFVTGLGLDTSLEPTGGLIPHGDALYFLDHDRGGYRLRRTDGTSEGTSTVASFQFPESFTSLAPRSSELAVVGDSLYFIGVDPLHGAELWRTDGTAEGTAMMRDIRPGPGSSFIRGLTEAGERLFFSAFDSAHGWELWVSDGSTAGTRLLHDLAPGFPSSFPEELTVAGNRLYFSADDRVSGRELWSLDLTADPNTCPPSEHGLCLQDDRFRVEIAWRTPQGLSGFGQPVALTGDTGYFWFFNPANVESIVKVLDGRGVNGHFWTFYGALSNVEYTLTASDAQTGLTRRYFNPQGQLASVGDTEAFGPLGASLESYTPPAEDLAASFEPRIENLFDRSLAGACAPASNRLCLNDGRFAVAASWRDFAGHTGTGTAVPLTADTGYFWFFRDTNVEVVLKVLDGRPVNDKFWVFYGALSNVEYTLTVTDTATGAVKTYFNPARQFASVADTAAF